MQMQGRLAFYSAWLGYVFFQTGPVTLNDCGAEAARGGREMRADRLR